MGLDKTGEGLTAAEALAAAAETVEEMELRDGRAAEAETEAAAAAAAAAVEQPASSSSSLLSLPIPSTPLFRSWAASATNGREEGRLTC